MLKRSFSTLIVALGLAGCLAGCTAAGPQNRPERVTAAPVQGQQDWTADIPLAKVSDKHQRLFHGALTAMKKQRYAQAEQLLLELTQVAPKLSTPWANLGMIYLAQDRGEEATGALSKAIEINPANCPAHNQMGILARQHGDFASAEASYLACLQRVPRFRDAYLNLGILYELYLGRLPEALDAYRQYQALLQEPDHRIRGWVMDLERRLANQS